MEKERKTFHSVEHCFLSTKSSGQGSPILKSNLKLDIPYCDYTWKYQENIEDLMGESFRESSNKLPPIKSEDEIICAATALTSLSLSPICSTTSSPQHIKEESNFSFQSEKGSDDNEDVSDEFPFCTSHRLSENIQNNYALMTISKSKAMMKLVNETTNIKHKQNQQTVKPRSYSHRDFEPVIIKEFSKPRSHSFDAVGRASKYSFPPALLRETINMPIGAVSGQKETSKEFCRKLGSPILDEGIGSSSGSADSVETPFKRKLSGNRTFRCMWRGCDNETTSLNGIIMHVRHAHIGPSHAGEEEFYFDDVTAENNITSGISSSEESLADDFNKFKQMSLPVDDLVLVPEKNLDHVHELALNRSKSVFHTNFETLTSHCGSDKTKVVEVKEARDTSYFDIPRFTLSRKVSRKGYDHTFASPTTPESIGYPFTIADLTKKSYEPNNSGKVSSHVADLDLTSVTQVNTTTNPSLSEMHIDSNSGLLKRKGRKKCRKVYGINNKHLWCTQCRWKKACVRFK